MSPSAVSRSGPNRSAERGVSPRKARGYGFRPDGPTESFAPLGLGADRGPFLRGLTAPANFCRPIGPPIRNTDDIEARSSVVGIAPGAGRPRGTAKAGVLPGQNDATTACTNCYAKTGPRKDVPKRSVLFRYTSLRSAAFRCLPLRSGTFPCVP